jgi:hypothetical protein
MKSAFGGKADIERDPSECLLMTQSGHAWLGSKSVTGQTATGNLVINARQSLAILANVTTGLCDI